MIHFFSIKLSTLLNFLYVITAFLIISCQQNTDHLPSEVYHPDHSSQSEEAALNLDDKYLRINDIFEQYHELTEQEKKHSESHGAMQDSNRIATQRDMRLS